ncbi:unnamed protein product [Cyclocybe aegerita]|uniref:Uncharacterized protein n=1 Tax=Cyclocybe aegerita TaxID=1973307 RepID=A0A8S0VQ19_CYCAE|nr:unnamed protein product [Cyclocybe aegerita]
MKDESKSYGNPKTWLLSGLLDKVQAVRRPRSVTKGPSASSIPSSLLNALPPHPVHPMDGFQPDPRRKQVREHGAMTLDITGSVAGVVLVVGPPAKVVIGDLLGILKYDKNLTGPLTHKLPSASLPPYSV